MRTGHALRNMRHPAFVIMKAKRGGLFGVLPARAFYTSPSQMYMPVITSGAGSRGLATAYSSFSKSSTARRISNRIRPSFAPSRTNVVRTASLPTAIKMT